MVEKIQYPIKIDLNQFKLHIDVKNKIKLTLHFDSPSRRFYLSLIAFVVNRMKKLGKVTSIPLQEHFELLALLNKTVGSSAGSSEKENLLPRIYMKWKGALPNLEEAPLFRILGMRKEYDEGAGRTYQFTDAEKDVWANLFEYKGSGENVRLRFSIDRLGIGLDDVALIYEDSLNGKAWEKFISSLKQRKSEPDKPVSEEPEVAALPLESRRTLLPSGHRWVALMAVIVVVLGASTLAIWEAYLRKPALGDVASIEKMAFPLPDVPSIAVIPFVNMSEDPKQEFLSDGMTDNIITALSKVGQFFVISRQSTFSYRGKPVKVKQVSEELGVRYVLEGSVLRSGDRIRINAQLIDALTGHHLWAERYERDLKDLFALQDEITMKILTATQVKLTGGEGALTTTKYFRGKQGLDCYLKISEGFVRQYGFNIESTTVARQIAEEAIAMCPEVPIAYSLMSHVHLDEYLLGLGKSPEESIEKGIEMAQKAIAMDDSIADAHGILSNLYIRKRYYDEAIAEAERAVALEPGGAFAHEMYAWSLAFAGWPKEAIPICQKAIRLNPSGMGTTMLYFCFGSALRLTGRYEEAVSEYKRAIQRSPDNILAHVSLTGTYSLMGREKEAAAEAAEVLRINPRFSVNQYAKVILFKDQSEIDKFVSALRKAGLK